MAIGQRRFHDFCWINVMTPQPSQAASFFQQVLGWKYGEWIPGGHVIQVDGLAAGALTDLAQCPPGIPPVIGVMIKVENADDVVARVAARGGTAEPVWDVQGNSRIAACTDPTGAIFNIWQPLAKDGAECDACMHGAPTWFELLTTDPERAAKFYSELFGCATITEPPPTRTTYTVFKHAGVPIAGAMCIQPAMLGKVPPHWGTYFTVRGADETVQLAQRLDAQLCFGPHDISKVGRFALLKSPQGVPFHVLQRTPS